MQEKLCFKILELIGAKPESLKILDDKGKNIFHLCVMYNHLEILKDLVALDTHDTKKLLIERDSDGRNTILHLAIMSKQVETVRYLISIPKIRSKATKLKNEMGHSAVDIVDRIPRDSNSLEIQVILMQHCGINNFGKMNVAAAARTREEEDEDEDDEDDEKDRSSDGNSRCNHVVQWMRKLIDGDGKWVQQMRANLSLVPTIVSTITFQAAINPPGGIIQQGLNSAVNNNNTNNNNSSIDYFRWLDHGPLSCLNYGTIDHFMCPGEAILAFSNPSEFNSFMIYNTIAFVASLFVAFLLLSGIPLKSKSMMWVLTLGMLSNLTFLLNAYFASIDLITPSYGNIGHYYEKIINIITRIFNACLILIAVYIVVMTLTGSKKRKSTSG